MRTRQLFVAAAALTLGGCFQSTTLVRVKGDGSGTIEQRMVFTGPGLAQLRQFAAFGGRGGKEFDPFSEEQAKQAAAAIGPNVTYVSSTPISTSDTQGRSILYAFPNITELRISQQPSQPGGMGVRSPEVNTADPQFIRFELTPQPNGNALLRIVFPEQMYPGMGTGRGMLGGAPGTTTASPEQLAMLRQMLAGLRFVIAIEPAGRVVKTSSPWVDGQKVTLIDFELDAFLKDDALLARLQSVQSAEDARALLKEVPGLKVNLDRVITIEFTPQEKGFGIRDYGFGIRD